MFDCMPKRDQVNFRLKPEIKADLEAIADYHGLTVTSYIHSLLVRQLRVEREATPEAFPSARPVRNAVVATINSEKAEIRRQFEQGIPVATQSKKTIPFAKTTQEKKRKTR